LRRAKRLWRQYGIFWLGAIAVGLVAVLYARLIDWGYGEFRMVQQRHVWAPLIITPAVAALAVWLTRTFFRGAEGSGIPQVIATLHSARSPCRFWGFSAALRLAARVRPCKWARR
jgi:H+/Cl- antiporter ClcA